MLIIIYKECDYKSCIYFFSIYRVPVEQKCTEKDFKCANGDCIPMKWKCDDYNDCRDKSDELNCPKGVLLVKIFQLAGFIVNFF